MLGPKERCMASSISSRLTRDELGSLFRVIGDLREESEVSRLGGLYIATADSLYGRFLEEEPSTPAPTPIQIEGTLTSEDL